MVTSRCIVAARGRDPGISPSLHHASTCCTLCVCTSTNKTMSENTKQKDGWVVDCVGFFHFWPSYLNPSTCCTPCLRFNQHVSKYLIPQRVGKLPCICHMYMIMQSFWLYAAIYVFIWNNIVLYLLFPFSFFLPDLPCMWPDMPCKWPDVPCMWHFYQPVLTFLLLLHPSRTMQLFFTRCLMRRKWWWRWWTQLWG